MADLVMIHGLGEDAGCALKFANAMGPGPHYWITNLLGHGDRPLPASFSMAVLADDLLKRLDEDRIEKPFLFGYSFGGRLALYIARHFPGRVQGICTLGANFVKSDEIMMKAMRAFDPRSLDGQAPRRYQDFHRLVYSWLQRQVEGLTELSEEDVRAIDVPVLLLGGIRDTVTPAEDAEKLYRLLPNGRLVLFEGTAHPPNLIPIFAVAEHVFQFIEDVEQLPAAVATAASMAS
jgi:pimeloyl-ACP methyl ester carboxylesterase